MFKIGDFSKLSMVSVKTLRFYDEAGLLKPAQVDKFTGYRYYSAQQLARLNCILALKDMGLSLEQIAALLNKGLSPTDLHAMLRLKQVELEAQLAEGRARLERVTVWLNQFEQEELSNMNEYSVIIKPVATIRVNEARGVAPDWERLGLTLNKLFDETCDQITKQGGQLVGSGITVYYDQSPDTNSDGLEVGACMSFTGQVQDSTTTKVIELPAFPTIASTIHNGTFANMHLAYQAILKWIEANGYRVSGPNRELNLEYQRDGDQNKYVTEIQFPIEKV